MKFSPIRPVEAARALRAIFADPDDTKQVFKIIEALQGPSLARTYSRLRKTSSGRKLLRERPDLLPLLCDREWLASLPDGTLGRAYLDFVRAEGITADGLVEASLVRTPMEDLELSWVRDWLRDTHDVWHAVLGYQGDLVGEAALLAFSHNETGNWGVGLVAAVAWIKLGRETDPSLRAKETVAEGRRIAQGSAWFVDVPWHEWLERPLEDVRRDLRIARPVEYHPIASSEFDATLFGRRQKDPSKAA